MANKVKKLDILLLVEDEEDHAELIIKGLGHYWAFISDSNNAEE